MLSSKTIMAVGLVVGSVALTGCKVKESKCTAAVDINQNNPNLRAECTFVLMGGRVGSTQVVLQDSFGEAVGGWMAHMLEASGLAQVQSFNPATFDAALVRLDTAGSSAAIGSNTGTFVLQLYRENQLLAASSFAWIRNGTSILVADPGSMNAWVRQHPTANGFEYSGQVSFNAGQADSAAIYTTQSVNGAVVFNTVNSVARPRPSGGGGSWQQQ